MTNWTTGDLLHVLGLVALVGALVLLARTVYSKLSSFDVEHELTEADNPAIGVAAFGYLAGVVIALMGVISTDSMASDDANWILWDLGETAIFGLLCIVLLHVSGLINDRIILKGFENKKELVDDKNPGVAYVLAGTYVATGLVLAGALGGRVDPSLVAEDASRVDMLVHSLLLALAFFALGQVVLTAYAVLYTTLSSHSPLQAIEEDYEEDGRTYGGNAAAGLALGGNFAAMGVVLWGATAGDFLGWGDNLGRFGLVAGIGVVTLPVWRIFCDRVLLPKARLTKEIYKDRNPNAALLETITLVAFAAVLAIVMQPVAAA